MTQQFLLYPLLWQLFLSIVLMFAWRHIQIQKIISIVGSAIGVGLSVALFYEVWQNGTLVVQAASWKAPFGISFVGDMLAATLVLLTSIAVCLFPK